MRNKIAKGKFKFYTALSISLITQAVYFPALHNEFVYWDDNEYVFANSFIRSFDAAFFRWSFLDFHSGNWHPITWMSHALDYAIWGLNPVGHHLTNNILHSINTFIVVLLVAKLIETAHSMQHAVSSNQPSKDSTTKQLNISLSRFTLIAAGTTGLLFGLHPLHVESVAWVAERKDLLCGLFYLLSISSYITYAANISKGIVQGPERKGLFALCSLRYALLFFILALMSKPMAVSLPAVLLILDWYPFERISSFKTFKTSFIEKLPFVALSIGSSIITVLAQQSGGAMLLTEYVPLWARILVAAKALIIYIWKMLLPLNLIPFYKYPRSADMWSLEYMLPVIVVVWFTAACLRIASKQRLLPAVWGYYVLTLTPVLGVVQVGGQSMADRYTYLPSLGPFIFAGIAVAWLFRRTDALTKWGPLGRPICFSAAVFTITLMSYLTLLQTEVWKCDINLWSRVIEKATEGIPFAYNNRGLDLRDMGRLKEAIMDFDRAIQLDENFSMAYRNRGNIYLRIGNRGAAFSDFHRGCDLGDEESCSMLKLK